MRLIKLKYKKLYFFILCINLIFYLNLTAQQIKDYSNNYTSLPALRRIAVLPIETNITEIKKFFKDEHYTLTGFVANPLSERDAEKKLTINIIKAFEKTARFWILSPIVSEEILIQSKNEELAIKLYELKKSYDLDAFIRTKILFYPDYTLLRIVFVNSTNIDEIFVREDIMFEQLPTEEQINNTLLSLIIRINSTIGHDGKITWQRDELVTIDFGAEKGLIKGNNLYAGFVVLAAKHPETGEFLRSKRITIMNLEVIEAKKGSSLVKITNYDDLAEKEIRQLFNAEFKMTNMLVWRNFNETKEWINANKNDLTQIINYTETGFKKNKELAQTPPIKKEENKPQHENKEPEIINNNSPNLSDPNSWIINNIYLGIGMKMPHINFSTKTTTDYIPINGLNSIQIQTKIKADVNIYFEPIFSYNIFNKNILGDEISLTLISLYDLNIDKMNSYLFFGLKLGLIFGKVSYKEILKNTINIYEQNFNYSLISPIIKYKYLVNNFFDFTMYSSINLLEAIYSKLGMDIIFYLEPCYFIHKNLGFYFGYQKGWGAFFSYNIGLNFKINL